MQVAAAIIAGGRARRLGGVAKPFLRVGGRTIAERQLAVLRPLFTRVLAVVAEPADAAPWAELGIAAVVDGVSGAGPLAGMAAALGAVPADGAVVCVAGDLPFLSPAILAALRDADPDALAAMPRVGERAEPLCARYAARLLPEVQARLSSGRLALHQLAEEMGATAWIEGAALAQLDAGGRAFLNVNTPEDLARAEVLVRSDP
ncbi:MAG TPA: molybdenum cofactor guanylyltransferase [Polyangia bacterium]|nr:molybdenum cofactor guanylyltransferase [Polyangia bacterium]